MEEPMSTRWSYTRWVSSTTHIESGKTYDTQLLSIYDAAGPRIMLNSESLDGVTNEDLSRILAEAAKRKGTKLTPATDAELDELRGCIMEWLEDIKIEDPAAY
jgi:hypothetical protein